MTDIKKYPDPETLTPTEIARKREDLEADLEAETASLDAYSKALEKLRPYMESNPGMTLADALALMQRTEGLSDRDIEDIARDGISEEESRANPENQTHVFEVATVWIAENGEVAVLDECGFERQPAPPNFAA